LNEEHLITPTSDFQIPRNRILRAAVFVAQGALLLRQESAESISGSDAGHLRIVSEGLQQLVPALQRLGRATAPEGHSERIQPQFLAGDEVAYLEAVL
jgi:hypothetical protein